MLFVLTTVGQKFLFVVTLTVLLLFMQPQISVPGRVILPSHISAALASQFATVLNISTADDTQLEGICEIWARHIVGLRLCQKKKKFTLNVFSTNLPCANTTFIFKKCVLKTQLLAPSDARGGAWPMTPPGQLRALVLPSKSFVVAEVLTSALAGR